MPFRYCKGANAQNRELKIMECRICVKYDFSDEFETFRFYNSNSHRILNNVFDIICEMDCIERQFKDHFPYNKVKLKAEFNECKLYNDENDIIGIKYRIISKTIDGNYFIEEVKKLKE